MYLLQTPSNIPQTLSQSANELSKLILEDSEVSKLNKS